MHSAYREMPRADGLSAVERGFHHRHQHISELVGTTVECWLPAMGVGEPVRDTELTISPAIVGRVQAAAILSLTVMHVLIQVAHFGFGRDHLLGLTPLFDLNQENNIPTWYSGIVLFTTASALGVVAAAKHQARARFARHWTSLAFIFLYMSVDELTRIHEKWGRLLEKPLGNLRDPQVMGGALRNLWVIPAFLVAAAIGLAYVRFLFHLPARTRNLFAATGIAFVIATVGMEMAGASISAGGGRFTPGFMVVATAEEVTEMASIAVFLCAVLDYASTTVGAVCCRFGTSRSRL
jgi:hypothetical protein